MCIAYSALKKNADFLLVPVIICSCIEAVDELFQDTLGYDCIEHDVNTISVGVCMTNVYSTQKKKKFIILAADTFCSCTEAVDELFQHTLAYKCMELYVNTITICVYMSIA